MTPGAGRDVRLSWIAVGHQSARDLGLLLPSLVPALAELDAAGWPTELLVVDSASSDDTPAVVRRLAPSARALRCAENRGFGAACNRGAALARGEWLALGNADLLVPRGGLAALPQVLASAPAGVAAIGPALLAREGGGCLSAGRFPTLGSLLAGLFRPCHRRKYLHERAHRRGPVDWVTGACFFVRADVFAAAGGFDERFFLYYEDVDLARRLSARGHQVWFEPALSVVHVWPHHGRPPRPDIEEIVRRSRRLYFARHRPAWELAALSLLGRLEPAVRRRGRPARRAAGVELPVRPAAGGPVGSSAALARPEAR